MLSTQTQSSSSTTQKKNTLEQSEQPLEAIATCLAQMAIALEEQNKLLGAIAQSLSASSPAPNIKKSLSSYTKFDWSSIGAKVVRQDSHGATIVYWQGQLYKRRSGGGVKGSAIWFSRAVGKGEGDENLYERLITFKKDKNNTVEPLDSRVIEDLQG